MTPEVAKMIQDTFALEKDLDTQIKNKVKRFEELEEERHAGEGFLANLDNLNEIKDGLQSKNDEEHIEAMSKIITNLLEQLHHSNKVIEEDIKYIKHMQDMVNLTAKAYKAMKTRYFQLAGSMPDTSNIEDDGK